MTDTKATPTTDGVAVYRRLAGYSLKHWRYLLLALSGLVINALTQPMFAAYLQPLLDGTFMDKDPEIIQWAPAALLLIFFLRGLSGFLSGYFMSWVGRKVVTELREQIFSRLIHLPVSYYDRTNSGQVVTKLIYHVEQVASAATSGLTVLVQDMASIIGLLSLMLYYSWELTCIVLLTGPIIALIINYVSKRFRRFSQQIQESTGEVTQISSEVIQATREVRIFGAMAFETDRFATVNEHNRRSFMKRVLTERLSMPVVHFIVAAALAVIIFVATRGNLLDRFSPGAFMSFMAAMMLLFDPLKRLTSLSATLQAGIAAGESIFGVIDSPIEADTGTYTVERVKGDVSFNHVTFKYEGSEAILQGISFEVKAGEKVALVGKSGSGKTTLMNLLPRFYDYQGGSIELDGVPLTDYTLADLRKQFAYVGQNITLFNDTVRNNIAYGMLHDLDDDKIIEAARAAHALAFIEALPDGFDTMIGENGTLLSGGQKQRLAIARAILADTPILILDEATSALDTQSERHIQAALDELLKGRTTFMIAHRLSTIEQADKILVMENGQIVESGTHECLLAHNGVYASLQHAQSNE
ncbi:MAG: lipid A export permease/ATP-binding protein MsbA [Proteobacteria bacterium]|nr:MAG: lipid A export permease/ATP-binding protein MsbA [Pseudomonadota bacterium]